MINRKTKLLKGKTLLPVSNQQQPLFDLNQAPYACHIALADGRCST
jgi:hypothetical protein